LRRYWMARCPNCSKEINFLKNYVYGCTVEYIFDRESYEFVDCVGGSLEEYRRPGCGYKITEDEQQAKKFLKG